MGLLNAARASPPPELSDRGTSRAQGSPGNRFQQTRAPGACFCLLAHAGPAGHLGEKSKDSPRSGPPRPSNSPRCLLPNHLPCLRCCCASRIIFKESSQQLLKMFCFLGLLKESGHKLPVVFHLEITRNPPKCSRSRNAVCGHRTGAQSQSFHSYGS